MRYCTCGRWLDGRRPCSLPCTTRATRCASIAQPYPRAVLGARVMSTRSREHTYGVWSSISSTKAPTCRSPDGGIMPAVDSSTSPEFDESQKVNLRIISVMKCESLLANSLSLCASLHRMFNTTTAHGRSMCLCNNARAAIVSRPCSQASSSMKASSSSSKLLLATKLKPPNGLDSPVA